MIKITFSTMIELLGEEVEKEVNVDFNEVFQRMTLDAIGREFFDFNVLHSFAITLMCSQVPQPILRNGLGERSPPGRIIFLQRLQAR